MSEGVAAIAAERQRQIEEEGWDGGHDSKHRCGEMTAAAACYAMSAVLNLKPHAWTAPIEVAQKSLWPWGLKWWKPKDPIRDLERAGALIAAQLDVLYAKRNAENEGD